MNNWYEQYKKEAGIMDRVKGLFTSKPEQNTNKEEEYLNYVVASIRDFIESNKNQIKPSKDGKRKLALWIWGNKLLKSLMEETPWDKNDVEMLGSGEHEKLMEKRIITVVEKLKSMGYNASLDYEGKSRPIDIEVLF